MPTSGGTEGAFVFLKDVQLKETADYDLITFEFAPAERGVYAVPKFQIQTAKRPLKKDPSDQPMEVTGQYLADIIFHGASGVDIGADGYREVYTGPKEIKTKLPILVEAEQQSDFEATLSWIMGLNEDRCWSPVELSDPARLEIRFIH